MKIINIIITVLFTLLLTACSGGGSSSGADAAGVDNDGNFVGTADITASAPGFASISETFDFSFVIQDNALTSVTLDDEVTTASIPLMGNAFEFSQSTPMALTFDDITCTASVEISGTISGGTASGPINGSAECMMSGVTIPITIEGSFNASR
jgi:hypothetical protein